MQECAVYRDTRQPVLADNVPITRFEVSATARRKLELLAMPSSLLRLSRVFDFQDDSWIALIEVQMKRLTAWIRGDKFAKK